MFRMYWFVPGGQWGNGKSGGCQVALAYESYDMFTVMPMAGPTSTYLQAACVRDLSNGKFHCLPWEQPDWLEIFCISFRELKHMCLWRCSNVYSPSFHIFKAALNIPDICVGTSVSLTYGWDWFGEFSCTGSNTEVHCSWICLGHQNTGPLSAWIGILQKLMVWITALMVCWIMNVNNKHC